MKKPERYGWKQALGLGIALIIIMVVGIFIYIIKKHDVMITKLDGPYLICNTDNAPFYFPPSTALKTNMDMLVWLETASDMERKHLCGIAELDEYVISTRNSTWNVVTTFFHKDPYDVMPMITAEGIVAQPARVTVLENVKYAYALSDDYVTINYAIQNKWDGEPDSFFGVIRDALASHE